MDQKWAESAIGSLDLEPPEGPFFHVSISFSQSGSKKEITNKTILYFLCIIKKI